VRSVPNPVILIQNSVVRSWYALEPAGAAGGLGVVLSNPIQDSLVGLSLHLVRESTLGETLRRLCEASLGAVAVTRYAAMSMSSDARLGTYVATDPVVAEVDRFQYHTGSGPGVQAFTTGQALLVRSTFEEGPYAEFRSAARRAGILSVLAVPMRAGSEIVGALNLYAEAEHAFKTGDIDDASAFAVQSAFVLANAQAYWDARLLSDNLTQAMESRAVIEQAKGIIMGVAGVSADEAFERLKGQSQHENVKVREIAAEIVRRAQRSRPAPDHDPENAT
jgi:GAF domain-containing protein